MLPESDIHACFVSIHVFELFEGVVQCPDIDSIMTYERETLPNQQGFMVTIGIQNRVEGILWSSRYDATHAFGEHG